MKKVPGKKTTKSSTEDCPEDEDKKKDEAKKAKEKEKEKTLTTAEAMESILKTQVDQDQQYFTGSQDMEERLADPEFVKHHVQEALDLKLRTETALFICFDMFQRDEDLTAGRKGL